MLLGNVFIEIEIMEIVKALYALKEIKYLLWLQTHNIGIHMNRKELTKTFMMISN